MCRSENGNSITFRKCEGNIGDAVKQEEKLCVDVETLMEFAYLGDRVSEDGECEAVVTARPSSGWVKFRKCGDRRDFL